MTFNFRFNCFYSNSSSLPPLCRYEIEYDENRLEIAKEIGRRFLGFDIQEDGTTTTKSQIEVPETQTPKSDEGGGGGGDNAVNSNSVGTPKGQSKDFELTNNDGDGPDCLGEKSKLVLDVLNDELVEKVREKMLSGSKDLFELCQTSVKAFLAGEPFQEFEHSMYFHRLVVGED